MKVKTRTPVFWPVGGTPTDKGVTLDVPDEVGADWIARGIADRVGAEDRVVNVAVTSDEPPPKPRSPHAPKAPPKGKR